MNPATASSSKLLEITLGRDPNISNPRSADLAQTENIRWGTGNRIELEDAEQRILSAAMKCYLSLGIRETKVASIAAAAKVTRTTVYRHFGSHGSLLDAVIRRQLMWFWGKLLKDLSAASSFQTCLVDALEAIKSHTEQPSVDFVFEPAVLSVMKRIMLQDDAYMKFQQDCFLEIASQTQLDARGTELVELGIISEYFSRILLSLLEVPANNAANEACSNLFVRTIGSLLKTAIQTIS